MEIIVNDFSIDNQFINFEEFSDSMARTTLPLFQELKAKNCVLYKSYDTYKLCFFDGISIHELFRDKDFMGSAEVTLLKEFMVNISSEEPYWNEDLYTREDSIYYSNITGSFNVNYANCLSEAVERNVSILSFEHANFANDTILVRRNSECINIQNIVNKYHYMSYLQELGNATLVDCLITKHTDEDIVFLKSSSGEYYSDNHKKDLTFNDIRSIEKDFSLSIQYMRSGNFTSRFTDSVTYKGTTYYEFRCSLENNREFRIYYYINKGRKHYLNSHIKKTKSIPTNIKDRTLRIIKEHFN